MKVELTYGSGSLKVEAVVEDAVARPHELMEMCENLITQALRGHHGKGPDEGQESNGVYDDPGVQILVGAIHSDDLTPTQITDELDEGSYSDWVVEAVRAVVELRTLASPAVAGLEANVVAGARDWLRAAVDGPDTEAGYSSGRSVDLPALPDWVAPMVSEITELRLRKGELVAASEHIDAVVRDGQGVPPAQHPECIPHWARLATRHISALRADCAVLRAQLDALSAAPE